MQREANTSRLGLAWAVFFRARVRVWRRGRKGHTGHPRGHSGHIIQLDIAQRNTPQTRKSLLRPFTSPYSGFCLYPTSDIPAPQKRRVRPLSGLYGHFKEQPRQANRQGGVFSFLLGSPGNRQNGTALFIRVEPSACLITLHCKPCRVFINALVTTG